MDTSTPTARLGRLYAGQRYALLFYSLLFTLAFNPLIDTLRVNPGTLELPLAVNMLAGVLSLPAGWLRNGLALFAVVAMLGRAAPEAVIAPTLATASLALSSLIALLVAAHALRFALRARTVDREHVYAALSAYILAGLFFGVLYWSMETAWPNSFADPAGTGAPTRLSSTIYFSFVTIATLGYGDIVPRTDAARGLAVAEAVGGQLYLAVLIARLVSAHVQGRGARGDSP
jgi:hypothetical protein